MGHGQRAAHLVRVTFRVRIRGRVRLVRLGLGIGQEHHSAHLVRVRVKG